MSSSERPPSPTPSERERLDAEARKKEEAEQATLPYKWIQKIEDVDVTIPIPGNLKAKDLIIEIKKTKIKAQIKGQDPLIDVGLIDTDPRLSQSLCTICRW
jgi:HSP20 family molecular chaperone IbpA